MAGEVEVAIGPQAVMSAPVQKAFSPVPVTITARASGLRSSVAQWASSASSIGTVSEFSFDGLSRRRVATAPSIVR